MQIDSKTFSDGKARYRVRRKCCFGTGTLSAEEYLPNQSVPIAGAVRYIREHYQEPELNVDSISACFGCTAEHFIRVFVKSMGITPYQYLLNMRMYEARRLLLENRTVGETAAEVSPFS